jgi:hypothetical protein
MKKVIRFLASMPTILLVTVAVLLVVGIVSFGLGLWLSEEGHEGFWTALLLHGVAELWGFAFGILLTFGIGIKLAGEKIKPLIELVAKLRTSDAIEKETARGVVICAARIFSEEKLTKNISTSIKPLTDECDVCALPYEKRSDFKCEHCGLHDIYWKLKKEQVEN